MYGHTGNVSQLLVTVTNPRDTSLTKRKGTLSLMVLEAVVW